MLDAALSALHRGDWHCAAIIVIAANIAVPNDASIGTLFNYLYRQHCIYGDFSKLHGDIIVKGKDMSDALRLYALSGSSTKNCVAEGRRAYAAHDISSVLAMYESFYFCGKFSIIKIGQRRRDFAAEKPGAWRNTLALLCASSYELDITERAQLYRFAMIVHDDDDDNDACRGVESMAHYHLSKLETEFDAPYHLIEAARCGMYRPWNNGYHFAYINGHCDKTLLLSFSKRKDYGSTRVWSEKDLFVFGAVNSALNDTELIFDTLCDIMPVLMSTSFAICESIMREASGRYVTYCEVAMAVVRVLKRRGSGVSMPFCYVTAAALVQTSPELGWARSKRMHAFICANLL